MPATFILTTQDPELEADWSRQLPGMPLSVNGADSLQRELQRPGARVWIKDICDPNALFQAHKDTVTILVGEPKSLPFEEAKLNGANAYCLTYEESRGDLRRIAALAAELAQSRAVLSVLQERPRRTELAAPAEPAQRGIDDLDFLAAAIDHLDDRGRIVDEFRRWAMARVRSSRIVVFLREGKQYVAENAGWQCPVGHDLVRWLQEHAAIVDSSTLDTVESAATVASLRQKLGEWNSRLLVPIEASGALEGWVVFGPRADGRPYSASDRDDSLMLVRLLSRLLSQHEVLRAALAVRRDVGLLQKSGPRFCVIGPSGRPEESLPVEAREVAALAARENRRIEREYGRLRVSAGPIPGVGGCWVWWDESNLTAEASSQKREEERHLMLHELGIMISHELANAMFSVSTYFQHTRRQIGAADPAYALVERAGRDMDRMKSMPSLLSTLHEMSKQPTATVDMNAVVQSVAKEVGGTASTPESGPVIWGHEKNLHNALVWFCREIIETCDRSAPDSRDAKIAITLQQRRRDDEQICLVSISYPGLRVEQIKVGEPASPDEYPTVPVYMAREIVRFHLGTVHVGQGIEGPELMIALRSRRASAIAEAKPQSEKATEIGSATPFGPADSAAAGEAEAFPESA
jgi:hypothetical protein